MIQSQRRILASVGMAAGVLAAYRAWQYFAAKPSTRTVPVKQPVDNSPDSGLPDDLASKNSRRFHLMMKLLVQLSGVFASISFSAPYILRDSFISYLIVDPYYAHLASRITLVAAMTLAAFISARRKTIWIIRIIAILLLSIQFLILVLDVINVMEFGRDPIAMLKVTVIGLCGLGVALSPAVFWLRNWAFIEPLAIGLLAISLGLLCLPGLSISTAPLLYPSVEGAALLFATGPKDQEVLMSITTNPANPAISGFADEVAASEDFVVTNLGKQPIHWALLVTGVARLHIGQQVGFHSSQGLTYRRVAVNTLTIPSLDDSVQAIPPFIPSAEGQLYSECSQLDGPPALEGSLCRHSVIALLTELPSCSHITGKEMSVWSTTKLGLASWLHYI
jgi:hypothetical protein